MPLSPHLSHHKDRLFYKGLAVVKAKGCRGAQKAVRVDVNYTNKTPHCHRASPERETDRDRNREGGGRMLAIKRDRRKRRQEKAMVRLQCTTTGKGILRKSWTNLFGNSHLALG